MQFGDYKISNSLILVVIITSVIGLGVATGAPDSIADAATNLVSGPQDNSSQTDDRPAAKQETDGENPDSSGEAADKSDSDTGESGETADDTNSRGPDKDVSDSQKGDQLQEENGGQNAGKEKSAEGPVEPSASISQPGNGEIINTDSVKLQASVSGTNASYEVRLDGGLQESGDLDGNKEISSTLNINSDGIHTVKLLVLKSGETQASEVSQFSINTGTNNSTDSATISLFDPSTQTYTTNNITLLATLEATDATYQVKVDGQTRLSGTLAGTTEISQNLTITDGSHEIGITITRSQKTLASETVNIEVDSTNSNTAKNGFYRTDNLTAGETTVIRLYKNGDPVTGTTVYFGDGTEAGTTNQYGEITFEVPNQKEITLSTDSFEKNLAVQGYTPSSTPLIYDANILDIQKGQEIQKPFYFNASINAGLADTYEIKNSRQVFVSGSLTENSTNSISREISPPNGKQALKLEIRNSENGNSTSKSVTVNVWEMVQITSPSEEESFSSNQIDFAFSLAESLDGSYSIGIDEQVRYESSIGGSTSFSESLVTKNSGIHTATFTVDTSGGKTYSRKVEYNVTSDATVDVTPLIPEEDGDILLQNSLQWNVTYPGDYWTAAYLNGNRIESLNRFSSGKIDASHSLSVGEHTIEFEVRDENSSQVSTGTGQISFEKAKVSRVSPTSSTVNSPVNFEFNINIASSGKKAILKINGTNEYSQSLSSGSNQFSTSVSKQPGTYEFYVQVIDTETGKSAKSQKYMLEVN